MTNVFYGENASGKTNLLEAIYLLSLGRSFRTCRLEELIKKGESFFFLKAEIEKNGVTQHISAFFDGNKKKIQYNSNVYTSFSPLLGIIPSVLFSPLDVKLIDGPPLLRRRFLNLHAAQFDPLYVHHLSRFWKGLKQRNYLLKNKETKMIDSWEKELARSAIYLTKIRKKVLHHLLTYLQSFSGKLSGKKELIDLQYLSSLSSKDDEEKNFHHYVSLLKKNRFKEEFLGYTLFGPHRDDFSIFLENMPAKSHASEGQKRTFLAALRLSQWQYLHDEIKEKPIMCIDDVGVHLDKKREKFLLSSLSQQGQVFLTMPIHKDFLHKKEVFYYHIDNGLILKN